jgi:predicted PurR-regulated permease PerM
MYLVVFGVIFGIAYFFLPPVLHEAAGFVSMLPQYLDSINIPFTTTTSEILSGGNATLSTLISAQQIFTGSSQGVVNFLIAFFGGIFSFFLVVVLSFYFAIQEQGVEDFLRVITPLKWEEYVISLWHRSQTKIGLWMQGQLMLSILAGILVYLGLLIVGAPYALLIGVLTALFEVIPVFGSLFAGVIGVAVAWAGGDPALAFIVAGLFVVVNQFESNLIYPLVVKKIVGVAPLLVIVALIAGAEIAGFLGAFLAVPIAAIVQEFIADLDRGRRMRAANGTA